MIVSQQRPFCAGQVVWTPTDRARNDSVLARYMAWLRRERGLDFPGYDELWQLVGHRPRGVLVVDLGVLRDPGSRAVRARAPLARDARRGVVPRRAAELRRAHGRPRRGRGRGRGRRALAVARAVRGHVRRAARAGGPCARRPAAARRRAGRPRRRLPAEHPGDARRLPRERQPRRDLGDLPARVRRRAACSTGSASSSRRCCSPSPATATATGSSTGASRSPRSAPRCRASRPSSTSRTRAARTTRCPDAVSLGRAARRAGAARVRPAAVRAPALRALLLGHDRPAEGDRARPRRHPRSST